MYFPFNKLLNETLNLAKHVHSECPVYITVPLLRRYGSTESCGTMLQKLITANMVIWYNRRGHVSIKCRTSSGLEIVLHIYKLSCVHQINVWDFDHFRIQSFNDHMFISCAFFSLTSTFSFQRSVLCLLYRDDHFTIKM
jgi:hypothetical protein